MDVTLEMETMKIPRQAFTAEFKELAVKRVNARQSVASLARELGIIEQTLRNWVTAAKAGKLNVAGAKPVTPEQMELSRLRACFTILTEVASTPAMLFKASERIQDYMLNEQKGNCWDNAPTESFFNSLKNERAHGTWYETRADVTADLFGYIEPFYNRKHRHYNLGYKSLVQFLMDWISAQS